MEDREFPTSAGILLGLGLGGFFDGIVLHQLLQWHHMLSSWYPVNTIQNLELNTRWDGIFHSVTYIFVLIGLFLLWRSVHREHLYWSTKLFMIRSTGLPVTRVTSVQKSSPVALP